MTSSQHDRSATSKEWLRRTAAEALGPFRFLLLALLGAFLVLFVALIWLSHSNREKAQKQEFATKVQSVGEGVRLRLKGNVDYLLLLALERSEGKLTPESFQQRASQYVRYHPELLNITWVDAKFVIRDVAPLTSNGQILGLRLNLPEPKRVSRLAMERRLPVYTRPFEAIQGMPSFEIWVPVYRNATFIGLFAGVYSCEGLVRQLVSTEQQRRFHPTLIDSSGSLLAEVPFTGIPDLDLIRTFPITPAESGVLLQLAPYRQQTGDPRLRVLEILCLALALGIAYAVAAQARANAAVRRSEERLRELLENTHLAAAFLDPQGKVTYCNRFLLEITGRSRTEAVGADWFQRFVPEEAQDQARNLMGEGESGELRSQFEMPLATAQGRPRTVVWDTTVLHQGKTVAGVAILGIDVTGQRNLEEQLRQSQKMEAIGQLAGGVAHDFNNILTVVAGFANLLQFGNVDASQKEQLGQIVAAAERGSQLTQGLLTFSRKQVMDTQVVNLNDIVQHVRQFLGRIIGEDVQLKTVSNQATLKVRVDRGQIEQVLINLGANARDAMPRGGKLTVETSVEEVEVVGPVQEKGHGLEATGSYAVITVSDTGIGMDEEVRSRLFEPFFTTKELGKGTGLGMAIVYGIVKQHNGQINVYSELGKGTTFRVYLPLVADEESPEPLPATAAPPRRGSETILLAEDDAAVRDLEERILTGFGYKVIVATDGEEAVELFRRHADEIGLIVMDLIMPGKSGLEAYEEIRKLQEGVKVLYTSGYPRDFIEGREELNRKIELLMKPVQPMALLKKVREMIDTEGN